MKLSAESAANGLNKLSITDGPTMTDDQIKAMFDVIAEIPPTWTCIECGKKFNNSPNGVVPYARKTWFDEKKRQQIIVGDICHECYLSPNRRGHEA